MSWCVAACALLGELLLPTMARAQFSAGPAAQVPATTTALLQRMASQSGRIFLGHVVAIRLLGEPANRSFPDWPDGSRMVEITLQVEDCVRGCGAGQSIVMHEWASLWRGQPHRYSVGQRAVWMIYPENVAGMSSPVNGMMGVLPVKTTVAANGKNDMSVEQNVDLRWVKSAVLRSSAQAAVGVVQSRTTESSTEPET
jgi:hypothetical protein